MTRMLLFSDIHADVQACRNLVRMAEQVDIVIGAGDFGVMRSGLKTAIDILRTINKPAVLVAGNSESDQELRTACSGWESAVVIHAAQTRARGLTFFGLGGGIPTTPFGSWSWDFSEEQARKMLASCPPGAVLISHSPPWGTVDLTRGRHLGSRALLETIQAKKPPLVICGHIHSCWGQQAKIGDSVVINAGPGGIYWDCSKRD